ncbi:MAG: glutathione S-transferase [Gammaproteobacteria bacterium]|jgi:glutathione S-transferase
MNTLYIFPSAFGLRNASPFCLKVEMALRYLDIDFEIKEISDPRKAPKGKLPYIDFSGEIVADSEIIFRFLDRFTQGQLYRNLSPEQHALGTAFSRLVEDHLYWLVVASRWLDDAWFPHVSQGFFGDMPIPLRWIVPIVARKQVRKTFDLHGLGAHSLEEQKTFARSDLKAISDEIGDKLYLFGEDICVFDFTTASLLSGIFDNTPATWLTPIAREFPNLSDYSERVQKTLGVYGRIAI